MSAKCSITFHVLYQTRLSKACLTVGLGGLVYRYYIYWWGLFKQIVYRTIIHNKQEEHHKPEFNQDMRDPCFHFETF